MKILVTGAAGFIGHHLCLRLLDAGYDVVGLDIINSYYAVSQKLDSLAQLGVRSPADNTLINSDIFPGFRFIKLKLEQREELFELFEREKFDYVVNLAGQAGVRYSLENPWEYSDSNIVGFLNILEACKLNPVKHLIYASSSSVYGGNKQLPFKEEHSVDNPVSFYAVTKKTNELMASLYAHLYGIPSSGLRFFTVYGPWGRPDMAPMLFSEAIMAHRPIKVFNNGNMERDFTYVGDIVESIFLLLDKAPVGANCSSVYNIGHGSPVKLMDFIRILERELGVKAQLQYYPMQPGDVEKTWADTSKLQSVIGYWPQTSLEDGIREFAKWFVEYKKIK